MISTTVIKGGVLNHYINSVAVTINDESGYTRMTGEIEFKDLTKSKFDLTEYYPIIGDRAVDKVKQAINNYAQVFLVSRADKLLTIIENFILDSYHVK